MSKTFDPLKSSSIQAARCLGIDRNTLAKWLEAGAPFIERAEGNKPWVLSVPEIIEWKMEVEKSKAVEAALRKVSPDGTVEGAIESIDDGQITLDEAKRRKAVADAVIREIQLDKEAGSVIPIEDVATVVAREYSAVRETILGIGPRVAPRIAGETDANIIAEAIREQVDESLSALQADNNKKNNAPGHQPPGGGGSGDL